MSKAILEFNLDDYDEKLAFKRTLSVDDTYLALGEISNKLFRPARKHGYGEDDYIQQCIDKAIDDKCEIDDFELDDFKNDVVTSVIGALESRFHELLEEHNINLDDLP
tara:strand:- start:7938 stop:8261 length:324 start_codon:yes stop_codon:yes gene_type:complete